MRMFNYEENDEFREDIDKFFEEDKANDYKSILEEEHELQDMQMDFVSRDLNIKMLRNAVRLCEKLLFWKFYTLKNKLDKISLTYKVLRKLEEE